MEIDKSCEFREILEYSVDPFELAEAAFSMTETSQEAVALLALRLSIERQTHADATTSEYHTDELGLEPRAAFNADIETAFARYNRDTTLSFTLGFLDLDNLKKVNDNIGHVAGDRYLEKTVSAFMSVLRSGDKLYRLGGDEIAGLFHDMDEEAVASFMERITAALQEEYVSLAQEFTDDPQKLADFELLKDRITQPFSASLGMSVVQPGDTPESLLHRADQAMYAQKRATKQQSEKFYPIE